MRKSFDEETVRETTVKEILTKEIEELVAERKICFANLRVKPYEDSSANSIFHQRKINELNKLNRKIEEHQQAINRIDNNTYGFCENCDRPISLKRLEVQITASLCASCARDLTKSREKAASWGKFPQRVGQFA